MKLSVLVLLLLLETRSAYTDENVALRGKATQSHHWQNAASAASNAIDGNRNANYNVRSCTHTIPMTRPWWRVDLLDSYIITSVVITNRVDCCAERLNGAQVFIGSGLTNPLVGTIPHAGPGESVTLTFNERVEGRYVTVVIPGERKILTLCEVEVYGYRGRTDDHATGTTGLANGTTRTTLTTGLGTGTTLTTGLGTTLTTGLATGTTLTTGTGTTLTTGLETGTTLTTGSGTTLTTGLATGTTLTTG